MISSLLLASTALLSHASAACTREFLQEAANAYLEAQTTGTPDLLPLADAAIYHEADVSTDITKGILSQAVQIDFNRTLLDTTQCAVFAELEAASNPHPYVIHTRIVYTDEQISTMESVVTDAGDWVFDAAAHLKWTKTEDWSAIAESARDAREVIQRAADLYLDNWGDKSVKVPSGTPCARLEGGLYTGERNPTGNTCAMPEFPHKFTVGNRRYVIDEEVGGVDVFHDFPWLDAARGDDGATPSTNLLRVERGAVRYIHEVTYCSVDACGR